MDEPRPGLGVGAADATAPDGDCWGKEQRNYRRSAAAAGKNPHCKTSTLSEIWLVSTFCFFSTKPPSAFSLALVLMMTD